VLLSHLQAITSLKSTTFDDFKHPISIGIVSGLGGLIKAPGTHTKIHFIGAVAAPRRTAVVAGIRLLPNQPTQSLGMVKVKPITQSIFTTQHMPSRLPNTSKYTNKNAALNKFRCEFTFTYKNTSGPL